MDRRKLSDEQVAHAQLLRDCGESFAALGKQFGVSKTTMRLYLVPGMREADNTSNKLRKRSQWANDDAFRESKKESNRLYNKSWVRPISEGSAKRRKESRERWRENNRGRIASYESARRAMILGATIGNLVEIAEIYRQAKEDSPIRCYLCGELIELGDRHVDHKRPLSRGGKHTTSNLGITCSTCNLRKGSKVLWEELA